MVASRVEVGVDKERRQEFRHCNRCPYHEDHEAQEPFGQADFAVGPHEFQPKQQHESRNKERGQSKAFFYEEMGCVGTKGATRVGKDMLLIEQLAIVELFYQALVSGACGEE